MDKIKAAGVYKNALSHGAYAQDFVLPWENERDFVDLHKGLRDELEPDGPSEEEVVLGVAGLYWKKRRLAIGSQLAYRHHPDAAALTKAGEGGWSGVAEYLQSTSSKTETMRDLLGSMAKTQASALQTSLARVRESLARLESSPEASEKLDSYGESRKEARIARENERLDILRGLTSVIGDIGADVIIPAMKIVENQDIEQSIAERVFRPDVIEREVKIGALIDRQIEKGLAQLVHLKEYKRLYKKLVTGPPTV
ncbi:MAG: hypothetical protein WA615_21170 [Bradyrhizobium sp.]|uniref:hypothetical protein n=1 Tax=Bradyrhizobium sp. TaxID=376 RepID=UPI003C798FF0